MANFNLYQHQEIALGRCVCRNQLLAHDCGTGKTLTALTVIDYWRGLQGGAALVVCPLSIVRPAWCRDAERFMPHLKVANLWHPSGAKKRPAQIAQLNGNYDLYIANFETFKSLYKELCNKKFNVLVIDESSKMKSTGSAITSALLAMAGVQNRGNKFPVCTVPHRYALSATPAPNDYSEYWPQVKFVTGNNNTVFHKNFYAFRGYYFHAVQLGSTRVRLWKFRQNMEQDFRDAMTGYVHVVQKDDVLDLPPQVDEERHVTLSEKERVAYHTMERDFVLQFGDELVLAQNKLSEIMKLRQLSSGFCYNLDAVHQIQPVPSKLRELREVLDELGPRKCIIWANFRHELDLLAREIPHSVSLTGTQAERDTALRTFRDNQGALRLIANPQSAGHGLSFDNCSYAVYYSLHVSPELFKQSRDRIHGAYRGIPGKSAVYIYLLGEDTYDVAILKALRTSQSISTATLEYLKGKKNGL